jgi:hypothetical protein
MILKNTINPIETSGMQEAGAFRIQNSQKAFKILSALYSDIHLAIVRELGCNSADSHVAAGFSNKPFHIHLPNNLEPWLIVQDFGTGISHKDIYDVYTTYFASTKTNSNAYTGMLGLGSKAFLAYTDTGTVTSITDGVKRIYNVFFNESGMPTIALMSQENTTDSNGLSIQIPVKRDDFNRFSEATKKAFRFFDTKPTISGGKIVWSDEVPTFQGDNWRSYESFESRECFAIMGGVTYPIDTFKLDSKFFDFVRHTGLVMFFDMGELDFTPSRESLEYGESTLKALNDKVQFVESNFAEKYNDNIKNKPNILEALKAVYLSERKFSFMSVASRLKAAMWNGIDISMPETYCRKILKGNVSVYSWRSYGRSKFRTSNQFSLGNDVEWYIDDLAKGTEARVKQFIKDNSDKSIMVISESDTKILIAAGFPDNFTKTSTLPKVSYNRGSGSGTSKTGFKIYTCDGHNYYRESWDPENYNPADVPKYYIVKNGQGFEFNLSTDKVYCSSKDHVKKLCKYMGIAENEICMVGKRGESTLVAAGSKYFKDALNNLNITIDPVVIATNNDGNIYEIDKVLKNVDYKALSNTHPFKVYVERIVEVNKTIKKYETISGLLKIVQSDSNNKTKPIEMETTDAVLNILCKGMGRFAWECADMMKVMLELETKEKELLTLKENCAKL